MAWCVFLDLYPAYILIFTPLHRYTVCLSPEFRDQFANAPPSHVQIKTSQMGVISFRYLGTDSSSQRDEEKILV